MSFKPEVRADRTQNWYSNGLTFATEAEAQAYVDDLSWRWTAVTAVRVINSDGPASHRWETTRGGSAVPIGEERP